jgi:extracellular factor (EF) 3-hydroxypalmitic acid methyl ester biosynthesis protein
VESEIRSASHVGQEVYSYTTVSPASRAVADRRSIVAWLIDNLAATRSSLRILSIGCGHLRELELSRACSEGQIAEMLALDHDDKTVSYLVAQEHGPWLRPVQASLKDLLRGRVEVGRYDLIYAAGLMDYLTDAVCVRLLSYMQRLLTDDGVLLVANFLDGIIDRGYMECCMDWWLTFRTEGDMQRLAREAGIEGSPTVDLGKQIVYLCSANRHIALGVPSQACNIPDYYPLVSDSRIAPLPS